MEMSNKQKFQYTKAVLLELLKAQLIDGFEFVDLVTKLRILYMS